MTNSPQRGKPQKVKEVEFSTSDLSWQVDTQHSIPAALRRLREAKFIQRLEGN